MKKKYEILNFNTNEIDLLEQHLNEMAQNHWHLKWISHYIICYEFNESEIYYYIDYNKFPMSQKKYTSYDKTKETKLNQFYEELGYNFLCSFDQYSIYESNKLLEKIHTDEKIKISQSNKTKFRSFINLCILPIAILAITLLFLFINLDLVLHLNFTNYYLFLFIFTSIALYMGFYTLSNFRFHSISSIKLRSLLHIIFILLLFIIPIYLFQIYNIYSGILMTPIPYTLYTAFLCNYLLSFSTKDKKYKNIVYLTYYVPYLLIVVLFLSLITLPKDETKNLWFDQNQNYPQTFVNVSSLNNNMDVNHYLEKESSLLTLIECRMKDTNDYAFYYYYYNDKKEIFKTIIMNKIQSLDKYYLIDSFDEYKFYSEDKEYFKSVKIKDYSSHILITKGNEYFVFHTDKIFTQEELREFIYNINWQN